MTSTNAGPMPPQNRLVVVATRLGEVLRTLKCHRVPWKPLVMPIGADSLLIPREDGAHLLSGFVLWTQ